MATEACEAVRKGLAINPRAQLKGLVTVMNLILYDISINQHAQYIYNKIHDPGFDLDTLGYDEKITIATGAAALQCRTGENASSASVGYYQSRIRKQSSRSNQ